MGRREKKGFFFFFFFFFEREREREKEVERKLETEVIINDILGKEGRGEKTGREGKEVPATNISSYFQIETGSWVLKFGPPPPPTTNHHHHFLCKPKKKRRKRKKEEEGESIACMQRERAG